MEIAKEYVGVVSLCLSIGEPKNTIYVSSIRRNLISIVALNHDAYLYDFTNRKFDLFYNLGVVGIGAICHGLYKINMDLGFANLINTMVGKKIQIYDKFLMLWQRHFGHISKERMQGFIKE